MSRAALWSILGLVIGMTSTAAHAQFLYSPGGYYSAPVIRPVFAAPVPVGISYYAPAPVMVASPVYAPVVQSVYTAPISYVAPAPTISYANYEPVPVAVDPVFIAPAPIVVAPAPVVVSHSIYRPAVVRESLVVRPYSSTYRAHGHTWGAGYHVYERSTPFRTVTRIRGW